MNESLVAPGLLVVITVIVELIARYRARKESQARERDWDSRSDRACRNL